MALEKAFGDFGIPAEILANIVGRFGADSGTIHWLGRDGLLHLMAATPGLPDPVMAAIVTIPVGKGMAGLAVARAQPVTACNIQIGASGDVRPGARRTGLAGAVVVPIFQEDQVVGALGIACRNERSFSKDEMQELILAGRLVAERIARA